MDTSPQLLSPPSETDGPKHNLRCVILPLTLELLRDWAWECIKAEPSCHRLWEITTKRVSCGQAWGSICLIKDTNTHEVVKQVGLILWEFEKNGQGRRGQVTYLWFDPEDRFERVGEALLSVMEANSPVKQWKFVVSEDLTKYHKLLKKATWTCGKVIKGYYHGRDGYVFKKVEVEDAGTVCSDDSDERPQDVRNQGLRPEGDVPDGGEAGLGGGEGVV